MTRRRKILCGVAIIGVMIGGWFGPGWIRNARIQYHRDSFCRAGQVRLRDKALLYNLPIVGKYIGRRPVDPHTWNVMQRKHHRDCLVDLGELVSEEVRFTHLWHETREGAYFAKLLWATADDCCERVDFELSGGADQSKRMQVRFWCAREDVSEWQLFFAKYDVPNFWEIRDPLPDRVLRWYSSRVDDVDFASPNDESQSQSFEAAAGTAR